MTLEEEEQQQQQQEEEEEEENEEEGGENHIKTRNATTKSVWRSKAPALSSLCPLSVSGRVLP